MNTKFLLAMGLSVLLSGFAPQQKKKIIFFGDSITEQGAKPDGYIRKVDSILSQRKLTNYELTGAGVGGNKVYDLYLRMDDDVLAKSPDAVVVYIGVNDVWHKRTSGTGTDADKFEKFYNAIIKKLQQKGITVILCTPAVIGEKWDATNALDGELNSYSAAIRRIATTNNCTLVDLRKAFLTYLQTHNSANDERGLLTTDGVHLNKAGNVFVAERMVEALQPYLQKQ